VYVEKIRTSLGPIFEAPLLDTAQCFKIRIGHRGHQRQSKEKMHFMTNCVAVAQTTKFWEIILHSATKLLQVYMYIFAMPWPNQPTFGNVLH
jgi:hypothetical protein